MSLDDNPYQTPSEESQPTPNVPSERRWITKRRIAVVLFAMPLVPALPIRYWILNVAGGWLVSTEVDPYYRADLLGWIYIPLIMSIAMIAIFPAFLLLWMDRCCPVLSAVGTVISGVLLIPAVLFLADLVYGYLKFG